MTPVNINEPKLTRRTFFNTTFFQQSTTRVWPEVSLPFSFRQIPNALYTNQSGTMDIGPSALNGRSGDASGVWGRKLHHNYPIPKGKCSLTTFTHTNLYLYVYNNTHTVVANPSGSAQYKVHSVIGLCGSVAYSKSSICCA